MPRFAVFESDTHQWETAMRIVRRTHTHQTPMHPGAPYSRLVEVPVLAWYSTLQISVFFDICQGGKASFVSFIPL